MITTLKQEINNINILITDGKYDKALELSNEIINIYPDNFEAYQERSEVYFRMGFVTEAFGDLEKIMQLIPNNPSPYFRMGIWCLDKGMFTKAIESFNKVIDLRDDYFLEAAHFYRAQANIMVKKYKEALEDCEYITEEYYMFVRIDGSEYTRRTRQDIIAEAIGKE